MRPCINLKLEDTVCVVFENVVNGVRYKPGCVLNVQYTHIKDINIKLSKPTPVESALYGIDIVLESDDENWLVDWSSVNINTFRNAYSNEYCNPNYEP